MSFQVGLGASENDLEVQGEIDFDFFDSDANNHMDQTNKNKEIEKSHNVIINENYLPNKPDVTGTVRRTTIETTIPSPENYTGNNCKLLSSPQSDESHIRSSECSIHACSKQSTDDTLSSPSQSYSDLSSSFSSENSFDKDECSDSMTDVSPLPSNCSSPVVKFKDKFVNDEKVQPKHAANSFKYVQKKTGVKFSESAEKNGHCNGDDVNVNNLLYAIKTLEVSENQCKAKKIDTPFLAGNNKGRRNVTFANEDVRKIDMENQRLLKRIVSQQNRSKPHFAAVYSRTTSSAINRQKQQRQIELDNLALLKRLEAAKPSRELSRTKLLNDYENRSTLSSRASARPASRISSQTSSCRSSARSCGRSLRGNNPSEGSAISGKLNQNTDNRNGLKMSINKATVELSVKKS